MTKKSLKIAEMARQWHGGDRDARYLGYFDCFNRGLFYEAHDVLEDLWLADRNSPDYAFYKGLIQLAGAFVHLQKHSEQRPRLRPSAALFLLARRNLEQYPALHHGLEIAAVLALISHWLNKLEEGGFEENPLEREKPPVLVLSPKTGGT